MTIAIRNATIVTGDRGGAIHYAATIVIENREIAAIGPDGVFDTRFGDAEVLDGGGRIVMPGFANAHTHFSLTLARGIYEDLSPPNRPPFAGGLASLPLPQLSAAENAVMCQLGAVEAIRSGTTAVLEDGHCIDTYAAEMLASGLRMVLAERAWDNAHGEIASARKFEKDRRLGAAGIDRISRLHAKWQGAGDGRIRVAVAAWAPDMCSPELLRDLRRLQERLDTICTIHLNQFWGEVEAVKSARGMLPTEYLKSLNFIDDRLIAAHCRCMTRLEEDILGRAGASVAFNATVAARRGLSPRIADLEVAGCNIAMGTDNMSEDMVEVLRTGMLMERVRRGDGRQPTPEHALSWATANGYRALGIADGGWLAVGNKADLIIVDDGRAHLVPCLRPVSTFVHQGQAGDVAWVMVDGRWLMRAGVLTTMDEPAILRDAQRIARKAWARLLGSRPDLVVPPGFRKEAVEPECVERGPERG